MKYEVNDFVLWNGEYVQIIYIDNEEGIYLENLEIVSKEELEDKELFKYEPNKEIPK